MNAAYWTPSELWWLAGSGWTFFFTTFMSAIFMWRGEWRRAGYCAGIAASAVGLTAWFI